ncbi:hypothetical protein [Leyella stercorea]|uniref:hypothetical protein n=1 Tax=Leyella stercorea TaxID=363265 RepID=UPI00242D3645|nr:hypothetical protein [Leyella stercorea]
MRHFHILIALLVGLTSPTVAQENNTNTYSIDGKHRGLDFSISAGYNAGVGDMKGSTFLPLEFGLGKQFHPNLYVGMRSGAWVAISDKASAQIPIMSDFKVMFPGATEGKLKPIINARLGYLLNIEGDKEIKANDGMGGTISTTIKSCDMIVMEIMPGIQIPLSKTTDFILSAGYTHGFATKSGGGSGGYFSVKTAFNFHKRDTKKAKALREKVDTRDKGLQLTIEGELNNRERTGGGGNLVLTYKINPHISVGLGGGYHAFSPFNKDGEDIQHANKYSYYDSSLSETQYAYKGSPEMYTFFARGNYQLLDKRLSPIGTIDLGMRKYKWNDEYEPYGYELKEYLKAPGSSFFVAPAIGASLRTTKNSYLELKVGYNIASNLKAQKYGDFEKDVYYSTKSKSMSYGFISIGFTHTFGKRGQRISR